MNEIGSKLTECCGNVSSWMSSNKFKLNASKTHLLLVGTAERLRNTDQLEVFMDGVKLQESQDKCELLLGVEIQANLKWHSQVSRLVDKLKTRLVGLGKLKFIVPYETRKTLTLGIFNSVLVYCLPLFGGCDLGQTRKLQLLQNKAAQIVSHKPPRTNRAELFDKLEWMTVSQLVVYHTLLTVFKIRQASEPEYLSKILKLDNRNGKIILSPNLD